MSFVLFSTVGFTDSIISVATKFLNKGHQDAEIVISNFYSSKTNGMLTSGKLQI